MMTPMTTEPGADQRIGDQDGHDVHGALAAARAETDRLTALVRDLDDRLELVLAASGTGLWEWQVANGALIWSDQISIQHGLAPGSRAEGLRRIPDDGPSRGPRERSWPRSAGHWSQHEPYNLEFRIVWAGRVRPLDIWRRPGLLRRGRAARPDGRHRPRHHRASHAGRLTAMLWSSRIDAPTNGARLSSPSCHTSCGLRSRRSWAPPPSSPGRPARATTSDARNCLPISHRRPDGSIGSSATSSS